MTYTEMIGFVLSGVILVAVIAAVVFAVIYLIKCRKRGKSICCGSCSSCTRYGLCDHASGVNTAAGTSAGNASVTDTDKY